MPVTTQEVFAFPFYSFSPSCWKDFQGGTEREWLITNGIGGFASSTIIGANTRSYHGLLAASLQPPVDRHILLSKIEEEVTVKGTTYQLSVNQYRDKIHPTGYKHLISFFQNPFPTWIYNVGGNLLKKWIFMRHAENTTIVGYELVEAAEPVNLYLFLMVTKRNIHHLLRADSKKFDQEKNGTATILSTGNTSPFLYVRASSGEYFRNGEWYYNFQYVREKERGLDFEEDLFHPGTFSVKLSPGEKIFVVASTQNIITVDAERWQKEEETRLRETLAGFSTTDPEARKLALSADAFLVKRDGGKSILAGFPWFNDWGRDAYISVPGLLLVPGRIEEAKDLLRGAARSLKEGLLPISFPDSNGVAPSYESVDTSLWFVHAVYKTWEYSRDKNFVSDMLPAVSSVIETYRTGKSGFAKVEEDGLLYANHLETPLTWMDAKVGHWVVTPRNGAAVEVNALWFNALKITEEFCMLEARYPKKADYAQLAARVSASFSKKFWNPQEECLYDCVAHDALDLAVRPNQIFALSLPFRLLPREKEEKVFKKVMNRLYTPFGLRTLDPADKNYKGVYQGDRWLRDGAYHQGTVWPWLLGPFMTAMVRLEGEAARPKVRDLLSPILAHLLDGAIGYISEIFWGDFPHPPAGCTAQAWSLAEVLRAYVEEGLGIKP